MRPSSRLGLIAARSSTDPNAVGALVGEIGVFLAAGMDGFFTDNVDLGYDAINSGGDEKR